VATDLQIDEDWYDSEFMPRVNDLVMRTTRAVREDAQSACPVDTGALRDSLVDLNVGVGVGIVASHLDYCAAVELGFDGLEYVNAHTRDGRPVRAFVRRGHSPEQPFLRPALYRERDLSEL